MKYRYIMAGILILASLACLCTYTVSRKEYVVLTTVRKTVRHHQHIGPSYEAPGIS